MRNGITGTFRIIVGLRTTLAVAIGMGACATLAGIAPAAAVASPRAAIAATPAAAIVVKPVAAAVAVTPAAAAVVKPAAAAVVTPAAVVALTALAVPAPRLSVGATLAKGLEPAVVPNMKPRRLKAALLTAADLPAGYQQLVKPTVVEGNLLAAAGGAIGTPPAGAGCAVVLDPDKLLDPATPVPALPPGRTAIVGLSKGDTGPMVFEVLAAGTAETARAFVARFAEEVRRCPKFSIAVTGSADKIVITQSPLAMPTVGDASVAVTLTIESLPVDLKMIAFAKGRVAGAVLLAGPDRDLGGFATIAQTAVRKLQRVK